MMLISESRTVGCVVQIFIHWEVAEYVWFFFALPGVKQEQEPN